MAKESPEISPAGIKLSKRSGSPLYVQLYEQFRGMILSQRLRPGDRLPASRNLANDLSVSRVIVSQAYEQLMMEGYLEGKTGSGTFVAKLLPDQLLNATKPAPPVKKAQPTTTFKIDKETDPHAYGQKIEILPFQIGAPSLDMFPYKAWHQVGNKVLKELKKSHLGYDDTAGHWPLRQSIASYLRVSRAVNCEAEQVIIVTGSQQGLNLINACLLKKGDKVWMEDPGYFGAKISFRNAGVELCPIPIKEDGLDVAYGIKKFNDAKLVYTTPSYQFPLGHTLSQAKRLQLLAWAGKANKWIIEDDYDSEFRYEGRPLPSLQGLDTNGRVIYSGTFSKVLFPGLRLAYIVLPNVAMVNEFKKVKENIDRQSPIMDQLILSRFMEEGFFLRHIRKMRLLYAQRQAILVQLIKEQFGDQLRLTVFPSGMHIICWLPETVDIAKFKAAMLRENLVISFINEYSLNYNQPRAIALGFTAFSKYKLKMGVEKLARCLLAVGG